MFAKTRNHHQNDYALWSELGVHFHWNSQLNFKLTCIPLAVIAAQIPQAAGLFFLEIASKLAMTATNVPIAIGILLWLWKKRPATRNCSG